MNACPCFDCQQRAARLRAPPEREPMEENEVLVHVRAIQYATKYLENNENLIAIKMFDINDSSKLGIRIDKKEEIFSRKPVLVLSKFRYRNTGMGNWWGNLRQNEVIGITKKGGFIPLEEA